ncbi:MAG: hypothetical protein HQL13_03855, partial [Candidatus Omnitrophica bacterium]|nr:hypothetical protein [Candidatus Omnitrophota bacterium]
MIRQTKALIIVFIMVFGLFWTAGVPFAWADQDKVNARLYLKKATYVGMDT